MQTWLQKLRVTYLRCVNLYGGFPATIGLAKQGAFRIQEQFRAHCARANLSQIEARAHLK